MTPALPGHWLLCGGCASRGGADGGGARLIGGFCNGPEVSCAHRPPWKCHCLCVSVYLCVCMWACVCVSVCLCVYVCLLYVSMCVSVYLCVCLYLSVCVSVYLCVCFCVPLYVSVCTCIQGSLIGGPSSGALLSNLPWRCGHLAAPGVCPGP